ncbi:putative quinol monooxygenase [Maridesulfovibrio sp. FT414]|uniref:putative quinol monooxygenase n=1 Tax=Maridesulfovibrio sp. FT414 TaxID=2979469 RepID=UPI003D8052B1
MFCGNPFILTVRLRAKEGFEDRLRDLLRKVVAEGVGHEGLLVCFMHQDKNNPARFMLYKHFTSEASFRMHLDSEVVRHAQDEFAQFLEEEPQVDMWTMVLKTGEVRCR